MKISPKYFPALLLILACFIRLVYFYQFQGNPFFGHLPELWDQTLYHKGAQAFIQGDPFARAPGEPNQQSPFYQYFLGIVYFFFRGGVNSGLDRSAYPWGCFNFSGLCDRRALYQPRTCFHGSRYVHILRRQLVL